MKRKLLSILLALSLALSLLPTMALADCQPSDPESWDTLTIKKADGTNAELNKDYTKVRTHDYNTSNGGLYIFVYTIKTAGPLTISGGGSYCYSSSRTEKAKVKIDSSVETANITLNGVTALASIEVAAGKSANFTLVGENYVDEILGGNATGTEATLTFGGTGSLTGGCVGGSSVLAPKIVINGGSYNLTGDWGAAIGGKSGVSVDGIIINDGELNLKCKANWGAGIGGGQNGDAKNITINGGTVNAKSDWGAAIGAGQNGNAENIIINGGTVVAESSRGAAIGGGQGDENSIATKGTAKNIQIQGGNVTAISGSGAAIGAGQYANASDISITGGTVVVKNVSQSDTITYYGTGIGAGAAFGKVNNAATNITISNANVTVLGNTYKAANKYKVMPVGTANNVTPIASNVSINCGVYMGKALDSSFIASGYSAFELSANTYIIGTADTVKVTDGKVVKGTFAFDVTEYASDTSTVTENDGVWTVTPPTVNIGGETETTAEVTVEQAYEVDMTSNSVAQEIKELDDTTKNAITTNTSVSGVNLTTEVAAEAPDGTESGLQAVVNAAVKANEELAAAIAEADTVNIAVKVNVVPTTFTAPAEATQDAEEVIGTVTFELKPTATVTVGTGEGAKSETVDVDNSMIDTSKPITVSIYTGFEPVKIVHSDDNGFEEVFRKTGDKIFTYNEKTGVCTLTISHFSELTAVAKEYVAQIKEKKYETLAEAVSEAEDGDTITLLDDVADAGTVQLPAGATLNGADHKITGDSSIYINAAGGTVQNVVFENIHNDANIGDSYKQRYGLKRDTGKLTAIYGNDLTGTATITGCTFDNIDWDAIQITPVAGATINVTDNTFKHTANEPAIRYVHIQSAENVDFTANVTRNEFLNCGKLVETGIEVYYPKEASKLNCSGNYMDAPMGVCIGTGTSYNNAYAKAFPFKDATLEKDVEIAITVFDPNGNTYFYPTEQEAIDAGVVAKIGRMGYKTLAKAIAAVPTDGTETTITMIADETINTNAGVTVGENMNVVLDLNGFTIDGPAPEATTSYIIKIVNGGILTVKDDSQKGTGRITAKATGDVNKLYGNYAINNEGGKFTLESGIIESDDSDTTVKKEGLYWAINTGSYGATAETTINGGVVIGHSYQAVRAYVQSGGSSKLTINGGVIRSETKSPISIQLCDKNSSNFELNITGGTIVSDAGKAPIYAWGYPQSSTPNQMDLATSKLSVSGGQFNSGNSVSDVVDWSNSTFGDCDFINAPVKCVSGGLYTFKVSAAQLANGYVCIENPKDSTHEDYPYIVTVAPTKVEVDGNAAEVVTGGEKADTIDGNIDVNLAGKVKKDVVEKIVENASETSKSDIQEQITEETVQVKDNATTKEVMLDESSRTRIDVELKSVQINVGTTEETPTDVTDCTVTTKTATYDVKPVVTVTTTDETTGETEVETLVITNEWLKKNNKVLTFTLPVPDSMTSDSVLVKHIKEDKTEETFNTRVETDESGYRFITIVATEFSIYELSQQTEEGAAAKIVSDDKTYFYSSLANAVSDAQDGDTIILLTNSETSTITVDREVSFTLKLNGKALKANIVAGEGYTLSRSGNTYTVTEYVAPTYSGGGATTYAVTAESAKNGKLTVDKKTASSGSTVTITVTPDKGFTLETLTVLDKNGKEIEVKNLGNNEFSFKMPSGKVTVEATFMEDNTMLNFFVDVKATDYFYDAVLWAAENGITQGTDAVHFSPNAPVSRAQVVTFLWRAAGCPEPKGDADKFTDLLADQYYLKAVAWAIEQGITKGVTDTTFEPETVCTRGQIVTFLARFAGVEDTETESVFADVPASEFFAAAVKWAKDNGVTSGVTETTFEPYTNCNRAQVVTFLYRWMVK